MHLQQIRISSNNHFSPAIQRNFQELVDLWVSAFAHKLNDGHEFGHACDLRQEKRALLSAHIPIKLWAKRTFFSSSIVKSEKSKMLLRSAFSTAWRGTESTNTEVLTITLVRRFAV
jgi:hypothetical protein